MPKIACHVQNCVEDDTLLRIAGEIHKPSQGLLKELIWIKTRWSRRSIDLQENSYVPFRYPLRILTGLGYSSQGCRQPAY